MLHLFLDYPFVKKEIGDLRDFPGCEEVLIFLDDFASDFGLVELTGFEHNVVRVEQVDRRRNEWIVEWRTRVSNWI